MSGAAMRSGGAGGGGRGGDLAAQLARLEAAVADRRARVAKLEEDFLPVQRNFRGNVNFEFLPPTTPIFADPPDIEQSQAFIVKKDTIFYAKGIEYSITAQGSVLDALLNPVPGTLTLSPVYTNAFFQFNWKVRDTGSDRDWQNAYLPQAMLGSTHVNGLRFGRGHCAVSGGSQVVVTLGVTVFDPNVIHLFGLVSLTSVQVQFNLTGVEVPA